MRFLAIIPAKGTSLRLPGKNLKLCAGRSLVDHAIDHCLGAKELDDFLVLSDDEEVLSRAHNRGVTYLREPSELTDDGCLGQALDWAAHARESQSCLPFAAVVCIQPTNPTRASEDIDRACQMLEEGMRASHNINGVVGRRDDKHGNTCGSVFAWRRDLLPSTPLSTQMLTLPIPPHRAIDIDTPFDLWLADQVLTGWSQPDVD